MQLGIVPHKERIEYFSKISSLGFSSIFKPCSKLGGDFWDFKKLGEDKIGVFLLDFAGHGLGPSLNTFRIKECFHGLAGNIKSPAKLMEAINVNIFKNYSMHATCSYAVYDKMNKKLTFSRAGHPFGIWYKKKEDELVELQAKGMALGFLPNSKYEEKEVILEDGDRLVFYTDGIIEAANNKEEYFGAEGLKKSIMESKNKSSSDMSGHIMKSLLNFIGEAELDDDITLVTIES